MLILPIKKEWFDMILSGEKKEEYREIKPYWTIRLLHELGYTIKDINKILPTMKGIHYVFDDWVMLKNGYGKNARKMIVECAVSIGTGKKEWGAVPEKEYYVFEIMDIVAVEVKE